MCTEAPESLVRRFLYAFHHYYEIPPLHLVLLIQTGRYEEASRLLANAPGCPHNKVLAYILTDQLENAMAAAKCKDPKVAYLKAIIAARQGNGDDVKKYLEAAFTDSSLKERAARDVEFAGYEF